MSNLCHIPSRPNNFLTIGFASLTATLREITYPQPLLFTGYFSKHLSPPPLGRVVVIVLYWLVILLCLWTGSILHPGDALYAYKWEKVGFRAAWVSVTQLPLIYLLSCKANPITLIAGISYERLNWIHRWAAITLFFTVVVHWSHFYTEWYLGGIVAIEMEMMTMVQYGFGAWGVVTWMVLSSFGFFRQLGYEFFVLQHIVAAFVLLWLVHMHVPSYAAYNVWMAVGFVVFDWTARGVMVLLRNSSRSILGYDAHLEPIPAGLTKLTIKDVRFSWSAGQHIYIYAPAVGWFGNHPFTIANNCAAKSSSGTQSLTLLIKAQGGLTKRVYNKATSTSPRIRVFLSGPWGVPPNLAIHDSIVLISSGTGLAFTLPVLQNLLDSNIAARRIDFSWIVRSQEEAEAQREALAAAVARSRTINVDLGVSVFVTCSDEPVCVCCTGMCTCGTVNLDLEHQQPVITSGRSSMESSYLMKDEKSALQNKQDELAISSASSQQSVNGLVTKNTSQAACCRRPTIHRSRKPNMDELIRPAVESALGETAVVICGSGSLIASARTYVAGLSDERAVHKGTGAQGIFLYTESYDW